MTPAIVLAAGESSRYGHGNKLLANYHGRPLIVHTVSKVAEVARPIWVVAGHQSERIIRALRCARIPGVHIVINHQFSRGLSKSLQTGLNALPLCFGRALLFLGDMPVIDAQLVRRLRQQARHDIDYMRPVYKDIGGHPVLLYRRLFERLNTLNRDHGAQSILSTVPPDRRKLITSHVGCLQDTDTRKAMRYIARLTHRMGH